jgi:membrane-associated phospholipid phosphatase
MSQASRRSVWVLAVWALALLVTILVLVLAHGDRPLVSDLCGARRTHPLLGTTARLLTDTANPPVTTAITVASAAAAALGRQVRAALALLVLPYLATRAAAVIRAEVARRRPELACSMAHLHSYSFPSGHALGATMAYGLVGLWLLHLARGKWHTQALLPAAAVWAAAVGWSRLALGVHYPTDVAGGMLMGIAVLAVANLVFGWIYRPRPTTGAPPDGRLPAQRAGAR